MPPAAPRRGASVMVTDETVRHTTDRFEHRQAGSVTHDTTAGAGLWQRL